MDDIKPRSAWTWEEEWAHKQELQRQRADYEERKKLREQEEERAAKQAGLADYLRERRQEWEDTTGIPPTASVEASWTKEFLDGKQSKRERERAAKEAAALAEYDRQMGFSA